MATVSLRPVTLTLPVEVVNSLDRIAEAEDRSRSSVVRRLIDSAFDSGLNATPTPAGVAVQVGAMENKPTPQPGTNPNRGER
jgi:hypothetical protein